MLRQVLRAAPAPDDDIRVHDLRSRRGILHRCIKEDCGFNRVAVGLRELCSGSRASAVEPALGWLQIPGLLLIGTGVVLLNQS
jgi:hypothetical protein